MVLGRRLVFQNFKAVKSYGLMSKAQTTFHCWKSFTGHLWTVCWIAMYFAPALSVLLGSRQHGCTPMPASTGVLGRDPYLGPNTELQGPTARPGQTGRFWKR